MTLVKTFLFFLLLLIFFSVAAVTSSEGGEKKVKRSHFPDGFLFGVAASSYQIEGGYLEDNKGLSNWDVFSHVPGKINNNDNGDVADDHYHRFLEDIDRVHSLGVNSYRFSISWTRILPRGRFGGVNPSGIAFYNVIIDNLLRRGIEPFVTVHHFDIPEELQRRYGGWLSPSIQDDFVHYAKICFQSFGDQVKYWATINEPNLFSEMAYVKGLYPPGRCSAPFGNCSAGNSDREHLIVMHNLLLSHAKAVKLYRTMFQPKRGSIGIVACARMYEPLRDNELDQQAARRALEFFLAWVFDPLVHGEYPTEMRRVLDKELPGFLSEEVEYLRGSLDFIGINYYTSLYAKDCTQSACDSSSNRPSSGFVYKTGERDGILIGDQTGVPQSFVVPEGLEKVITYVAERYNNIPIFVTENGYSPPVQQNENLLQDVKRIEFHQAHLSSLAKAMRNGADVRGYFVWSLMDNFEWQLGYDVTFGLYYVNRQTLERKPKLSARWFRDFLTNCSYNNSGHFSHRSFTEKIVLSTH